MRISRRDFVGYSSGLLSSFLPLFNLRQNVLLEADNSKTFSFNRLGNKNILVIIHFAGGNDWFNTIIPYKDKTYYTNRPTLAISKNAVLRLDEQFALHPSWDKVKDLYDKDQVAILLNGGSRQKILSHHSAVENMQYGLLNNSSAMPWRDFYNRCTEQYSDDKLIFPAINIEPMFLKLQEQVLRSEERIFISSLATSNKFKFDMDSHYCLNGNSENYDLLNVSIENLQPSHFMSSTVKQLSNMDVSENIDGFSRVMNLVANLILSETKAAIYHISLGGFDLHVNQSAKHAHLLSMFSNAIFSFQASLEKSIVADKVLTVVRSEFGRSYKENDNFGTDHGHLNHILAIGHSIKGGIYRNA